MCVGLLSLSAFVRAAAGVVEPVPGLFVGPTRNREARRGGNRLVGTDGNTLVRAGGLERCTGAASAETHKVINTPRARTTRIAFAQSVSRKGYQLIMCARAASAPSCGGFTIGQICGIMSPCPSSPASERLPWGDARRGRSRSFDLLLRLSAQIPTTSPPPYDESRKAYLGYYAYWGAYTINDAGNGVIRNVQGSERPGEVGLKYPKSISIDGTKTRHNHSLRRGRAGVTP